MDESFEEEKPRNLERKQKIALIPYQKNRGNQRNRESTERNFWNVYSISYLIELI